MANIHVKIAEKIIEPPFLLMKPGVSEEEFFQFATEDISCELINGILMIHSPASIEHERIFKFLLILLDQFLKETNGGEVLGSRIVMKLAPDLIPEPDLIIVFPENRPKIKATFIDGPADMIFEILSPSTKETDLSIKIPRYLENHIREIWVIDPMLQECTIFQPNKAPIVYKKEGIIKSTILENFWIQLEWLWAVEKIKPLECLKKILEIKSR
ncbi:MAG: Uma2 family endonuclease [Candidatus Helarchaeota archaeon]